MPVFRARKMVMLVFAICVMPIFLVRFADSMWEAVALVSLAAAAHQAWSANIYTTVSDVFPKSAVSSVTGIGGMAGAVGGILFPLLVGNILEHYRLLGMINSGYNILFLLSSVAYVIAWTIMHYLMQTRQQAA
jgi:ACS family hexuronate transporter-like MFS transporter